MSKIERRIEQAEKALTLDGKPTVVQIAIFGEGPLPLPPDERRGNMIIRYVNYRSG